MDDKNIKNNNIENWEQELKSTLSNHKEPTDSKDLDVFMEKLEGNEFFTPKGRDLSGLWAVLSGMLVVSVGIWFLYSEEPENVQQEVSPTTESTTVIDLNQTIDLEETQKVENNSSSDIEDNDEESPLEENIEEEIEPTVIQPEKINIETNHKKEVTKKPSSKKVLKPTSTNKDEPEKAKKAPTSGKRIVMMSTDTTVVADTTHIKHRKKDKRIED